MQDQPAAREPTQFNFFLVAVFVVLAMLGGLGFITWFASAQHHEAVSVIRISKRADNSAAYMTYKETRGSMLLSPMVLGAATKDPTVVAILRDEPDPVGYLSERVKVDLMAESELLRVRFRGGSRSDACEVLDAVINAYMAVEASEVDGDLDAPRRVQIIQQPTVLRSALR